VLQGLNDRYRVNPVNKTFAVLDLEVVSIPWAFLG
jgi:hypothetical protein